MKHWTTDYKEKMIDKIERGVKKRDRKWWMSKKIYCIRCNRIVFWLSRSGTLGCVRLVPPVLKSYIGLHPLGLGGNYYSGFHPDTCNQGNLPPMHQASDLNTMAYQDWPIRVSILPVFSVCEEGVFLGRENMVSTDARWEIHHIVNLNFVLKT